MAASRPTRGRARRWSERGDAAQGAHPLPRQGRQRASHCGSGCTLGDICAEWLVFLLPAVATWFGWGWLFHEKMFATWVVDYLFAFGFGVAFRYFTIKPMRDLSVARV